jgi:hypothetical protein
MDVVQDSFTSGDRDLPDTIRTSIITLIYKKKDCDDFRNTIALFLYYVLIIKLSPKC